LHYQQHHPYDQQPPSSITSLDFSEPYGTLVASYSEPDKGVRVYDLSTGTQASDLKGHRGIVKSLLVEGNLCVTGGQDGKIVLWDLPTAIEEGMEQERIADVKAAYVGRPSKNHNMLDEQEEDPFFTPPRRKAAKQDLSTGAGGADEDEEEGAADLLTEAGDGFSRSKIRFLEGHSKDVTCLSYEDSSLVSGSSDKTLRLWDLNTGQCVVTMDILWAISNPLPVEVEDMQPAADVPANEPAGNRRHTMAASVPSLSSPGLPGSPARGYDGDYPWSATSSSSYMTPNRKRTSLSGLRRLSSQYGNLSSLASPSTPTAQLSSFSFAQATPPYSDGSWEMYSDFVGGLQLWSYALASGSADGCVRMWDTRTGQNVRSLIGHTGAITSLQFDNYHLMSGSLDKSLRIWDLRTGKTSEIIKYDGPVTDLQFDSRRILVAGGRNSIQVFNRTTLQQTELIVNGHTSPVEKLRFMDKYLATGGRDSTVKIWSLA
jgi:division protein 1